MTPDGKPPAKDAKVPDVAEIIKNMQAATAMLPTGEKPAPKDEG